jgi:hypothetical protein
MAAIVLAGAIVVALAPAAVAQEVTPAVTLEADRTKIPWGEKVLLSGAVSPAEEGAVVEVVDQAGALVGTATTGADGTYSLSFSPQKNVTLVARRLEIQSDPVTVRVKPKVKVALYHVRLFGRALVTGNVQPALAGQRVTLTLLRHGKPVATKKVRVNDGRFFKARFRIRKPGKHRVRAAVSPADMLGASDKSRAHNTPLPSLSPGGESLYVKLLEWRLRDLGYYLPGANRVFDHKTVDALIAFAKVQRVARNATVNADTWRRLASPIKPRPRAKSRFHIEIDQTRQVIFVVKNSKVRWILHTSTGKPSTPTYDGVYKVWSKVAGYSPKRLYYPSFFHGQRGIHGWPEVPTYAASHGCARVPMWAAQWIYGLADIGTTVRVYH